MRVGLCESINIKLGTSKKWHAPTGTIQPHLVHEVMQDLSSAAPALPNYTQLPSNRDHKALNRDDPTWNLAGAPRADGALLSETV